MVVLEEVLRHRLRSQREPDGTVTYSLNRDSRRWSATRWQVLAVAVGARMTGFLKGRRFLTEVSPLLSELMRSLRPSQRLELEALARKIHVVGAGQKRYDRNEEHQEKLAQLLDGLLLEQPVALSYHSHSAQQRGQPASEMEVHPLCLVLHRGALYFVVRVPAWEGALRLLALDRILDARLEMDAPRFQVPTDFEPQRHFASAFGIWTGTERHKVSIRIEAEYAPYVAERSWHPSQRMTFDEQGRLLLEMTLGDLHEVEEWLLGMGQKAEILEPGGLLCYGRRRRQYVRVDCATKAVSCQSRVVTPSAPSPRSSAQGKGF